MDLSIIIVNWRSKRYLHDCLRSILDHSTNLRFEIIVIDNASYDGAAEMVAEQFPQVIFLQSAENLGFAKANNRAFESSRGRNVLFLNPDTEVQGPALSLLMSALETQPGAGIVGARLLNSDLSIQTSCVQAFPTILNQVLDLEFLRRVFPGSSLWGNHALISTQAKPVPVEAVSGACLMIKRDVFLSVGQFTTDYFMYSEDIDLCYKVSQTGWKNYYIGQARVIHHGGRSSGANPDSCFEAVTTRESALRYMRLRHGKSYAALYRLTTAMAAMIRLGGLGLAFLFAFDKTRRKSVGSSITKWTAILRWTLGLSTSSKAAGTNSSKAVVESKKDVTGREAAAQS
jgi:hypothetical protein